MKNVVKKNLGIIFPFLLLLVLFVVFSIVNGQAFFNAYNIRSIISKTIPLTIGAFGLLFVVAQGSIDISTGANLAFSAAVAGTLVGSLGVIPFMLLTIVIAAAVGFLNGVLVAHFKVPSIMVTIATMITLKSFQVMLTRGRLVSFHPSTLELNKLEIRIIILLIATAVAIYLFSYSKIGYGAKFLGENEVAAAYVGLKTKWIKVIGFLIAGAFVGLAASLTSAQIGGLSSQMGQGYELRLMMAVYVGGVPVEGGSKSSVVKVLVGALLISILESGLIIANVGSENVALIQGILLLASVALMIRAESRSAADRAKAEVEVAAQ